MIATLLAFAAGAIASIAGFGIGSLLTPLLTIPYGAKLAVAAVSIPHFFATALRFWKLRAHIDRKTLIHFGVLSAAGGLTGAVFHAFFTSQGMAVALGLILIFAGVMGLFGQPIIVGKISVAQVSLTNLGHWTIIAAVPPARCTRRAICDTW